jgi:hypothetical protein
MRTSFFGSSGILVAGLEFPAIFVSGRYWGEVTERGDELRSQDGFF